jgi:hypothetical protein
MRKEKIIIIVITGCIVIFNLINVFYLCSSVYNDTCFVTKYSELIFVPIFWISSSLLITSIFTFFISDQIFKKWLKFTLIWFGITVVLIILAPVSARDPLGIGPTKELVSMNMSWIFTVISLIMFIYLTIKEKKQKN